MCCHVFIIAGGFSCYRILMSFVKPGSPHCQGVINIGISPIPRLENGAKSVITWFITAAQFQVVVGCSVYK